MDKADPFTFLEGTGKHMFLFTHFINSVDYIGDKIHSGIVITTYGYSGIAYIGSWNCISFRSVITDNLAMEGFKVEELVCVA